MKILKLLSALIVLSFLSCDPKDDDLVISNNPKGDFSKNFGATATRDFIGQVVTSDNFPISGANIKIGNSTAITDSNGVFVIDGAEVYEKFAHISVEKTGYISGSRSLVPIEGKNDVKIMLIPANTTLTVSSGASSTVNLPNGSKVVFDGAFQDESGNTYSGNVNVTMYHLETSNENIASLMPGMLYAQNASGSAVGLETFGMLHVELTGSGGQKLQPAAGHTAQITLAINGSQVATAPAIIPLWHFDEQGGYWKEEGQAVKQGNKYIGNVSHFSWWNVDMATNVFVSRVHATDANGRPLQYVGLSLTSPGSPEIIYNTQSDGGFCFLVPLNQAMELKAYDACGNVLQTRSIGPLATPSDIGDFILNQTVNIKGKLMKCDLNTPVTSGYVQMHYGNAVFLSQSSNGVFDFAMPICANNPNFSIKGDDFENFQTTGSLNFTIQSPITDLGNLITCNSVTEYIVYQTKKNGVTYPTKYIFDGISAAPDAGFPMFIEGRSSNQSNYCFIICLTFVPGFYSGTSGQFEVDVLHSVGNSSETWAFRQEGSPGSVLALTLNQMGGVGEYIDISFRGNGISGINTVVETIGYAHVLRDQ